MTEFSTETNTWKTKSGISQNFTEHKNPTDIFSPIDGLHLLTSAIHSRPRSESSPTPIFYDTTLPDGPAQRLRRKSSLRSRGYSYGNANDEFEEGEEASSCPRVKGARWTPQEHNLFIIGLERFGHRWKKVSEIVKTRNEKQIRSHAQKYFLKLEALNKFASKEREDPKELTGKEVEDPNSLQVVLVPTAVKAEPSAVPCNETKSDKLLLKEAEILAGSSLEPLRILSQLYDLFPRLNLDPILFQQWSNILEKTLVSMSMQTNSIPMFPNSFNNNIAPIITPNFPFNSSEHTKELDVNFSGSRKTTEISEGRIRSPSFSENCNYTERIDLLRSTLISKYNCQQNLSFFPA